MDNLFNLGPSISYDRVLRLSAEIANRVCQSFHMEQVVCPPMLKGRVFTTAAVDNLDHNPSATTANDSFHGTGISLLLQYPVSADEGCKLLLSSLEMLAQEVSVICHISILMCHLLHAV